MLLETNEEFAELDNKLRLALFLKYFSEQGMSAENMFDIFGINQRTLLMYEQAAEDKNALSYYATFFTKASEIEKQLKKTQRRSKKTP